MGTKLPTDSIGVENGLAEALTDRMGFVADIAKQFNKLMNDKKYKPQLERDLQTIRGWLDA